MYEADPRHTEILRNSLGLSKGNSAVTPGQKEAEMDPDVIKSNESTEEPGLCSHIVGDNATLHADDVEVGEGDETPLPGKGFEPKTYYNNLNQKRCGRLLGGCRRRMPWSVKNMVVL